MATPENFEINPMVTPFPSPSTAPDQIYPNSSAEEVRLYVYGKLREAQPGFNQETGWQCACRVVGSGRQVLQYSEEQWVRMLGEYGDIIFNEIENAKKYAKVSNMCDFTYHN